MDNRKPIRQGDILIFPISSLPKGEYVEHSGKIIVAEGEQTGHRHTLCVDDPKNMNAVKINNVYFVDCKVNIPLKHQEHEEIMIPKGFWAFGRQIERDPYLQAIRFVQD